MKGCYCPSRMVKHPKTQPNEGAWVVPPPFRCWISRKSDLLKIMSECYPLALRCFRWQYRLVMHYIKSTHSGYLEAKGFQDLSTYSWESHMKTIASNFWTHCIFQELRQPKHVKYETHTVCEIALALKTRKLWSLYSLSVADSQSLVQCLRHKRASTVRRSLLHLIFYYALPSCCRRVTGRGYVKSGFQLPDEKEAEAKWGTTTMNWCKRVKAAILRWFQVKGINYTKLMSRSADWLLLLFPVPLACHPPARHAPGNFPRNEACIFVFRLK